MGLITSDKRSFPKPKKNSKRLSDHYSLEGHGPSPRQLEFHNNPALYRLYGGAKGGGKSVALLWEAINWCLRVPGCNVLLLRRTYPELEKGLLRHFELLVPPEVYGGPRHYNKSNHTVMFPNGSKLFFGCAQHEHDVMSYQGHEYVFIGIDEATEWTYWMFEFLTLQNRCPIKYDTMGNKVVPCMALGTNPGGVGHRWIKALFIGERNNEGIYVRTIENIRKHIPELKNVDLNLADYAFIPAKVSDNPSYAEDEGYLKKLRNMNQADKDRYLLGSWETFEGSYFCHGETGFDPALTQMDRFTALRLVHQQSWHPKWIGVDVGYQHHTAVYWFSPVTISSPDGSTREATIAYREMVINETGEAEIAQAIIERSKYKNDRGEEVMENIEEIYMSPDAFAKRTSQNTIAEMYAEVLVAARMPYPVPADDDRVGGARLIDEMLSRRPDPDLLISEDCEELLVALPTWQRDKRPEHNEKVLKTETKEDDIYDGFRYGLKSRLASGKTPYQVERERALSQCSHPQQKFWTDLQLQSKRKQDIRIRLGKPRSRFPRGQTPW